MDRIQDKVEKGDRLTREEGLYLLSDAPLLDLAPLAQIGRFRHNPENVVTFVIDTNLNYSNVCDAYCTFCAFFRPPGHKEAYTHSIEAMMERFGKAVESGCTTVLLQGGVHPELPLDYYVDLVKETRRRFPHLHPHFFSAPEIMKMVEVSGLSLGEVLEMLKEAGLNTLPGGGAEVLSDRVKREVSRIFPKEKTSDWIDVHREAHRLGYRTTATMMYGHVEEDRDVIEHFEHIRKLQDETDGFTAFIPWSYKRENTALAKKVKVEAGPNRYLRIMAVSRIYLDNFRHIQASWFSEGKKTGQVALHFGGDDFGGTLFEEDVMLSAGFYNRTTTDEVITLIREAGFTPAQRTTLYGITRYFTPTMSREGGDETRPRPEARA
ncbi:MAG: dehypoxanthine futalosine cyclase [Candidatus Latescibacteria bacterium]|nr:dehypoxanthine futalosine cyclase [Candidatus Latescibacterota bacterium]NIM22691.1 dehypoxanthine futalosine cyclase [Candidatus Latescibacterota bacterium]NIM64980.1 dehypoxanthine futalosine cyclase [Candidatus Latescibacterota bacterium]NIO01495.1 dehypoxanthine futalosine cyclase [Candidatus Latescibacterota bacterium]NIO28005.1 dehypoxanthine futalosine cyclase [Candidatus Latescibacterota bacterium]